MTYSVHGHIGAQPINETSTVQNHPLGTIVKGVDPTFGEAEFIYLLGVASTVVGSIVSYAGTTYQTALGVAVSLVPRPVAVAMSANVASQYGWYQISGTAVAAKSSAVSFAAGAAVGLLSTATGLAAATASGNEVQGAIVAAVASAASGRTTVRILVNRPHMQGRIT
jgi:hypothetical protein